MVIGIDVSQLAYENTGVANYLHSLIENIIRVDRENEYVLFFSSLRRKFNSKSLKLEVHSNVTVKEFKIPPSLLNLIWNKLHILPIEKFIGPVDVFITSDWTEPPTMHAKKATIIYDLLVYKFPNEMHNKTEFNPLKLLISPNIVKSQKRKLKWVRQESSMIFCISKATLKDVKEIFGIESEKLCVIYPGVD